MVWLWVAVDADTKLVPCWKLGDRNAGTAFDFVHDLADRLSNRIQLKQTGNRVYLTAVESAFGSDIDYAMLVKMYGLIRAKMRRATARRNAPVSAYRNHWQGRTQSISAQALLSGRIGAYAPRCDGTLVCPMDSHARFRTMQRRSHCIISPIISSRFIGRCELAPAMAAGVTDRLWEVSDLVALWESEEAKRAA